MTHHFEEKSEQSYLKKDIKKTLMAIDWCLQYDRIYDINTLMRALDKKVKNLQKWKK